MNSSQIRLFSTALDGTLLGNPEARCRFAVAWQQLLIGRRPILVYTTRRTMTDAKALAQARDLPEPDFFIGSVGTELHDALYISADDFRNQFGEEWNRELVHRVVGQTPGVTEQLAECQHAYKSSWYRRSEVADFLLPGVHGIIVGNALPEWLVEVDPLKFFHARAAIADGVVAGLRHFGVIREPECPAAVHPQ